MAEKKINKADFQFVTIIGNRIMTNLLVAEKNDLMIVGWLIRDLGLDLLAIASYIKDGKSKGQRGDAIEEVKKLSIDYLKFIREEIIQESINAETLFDKYYVLQSKLRKRILNDAEATTYDSQTEFSKLFAIKMIDIFYSNKKILLTKQNNLLPAIANELSRTYNAHGGKEILYAYFVFKAFNDFYKYAYLEMFLNEEKNVLWDTKSKVEEYSGLIYEFKSKLISSDSDLVWAAFNDIVSKIGLDFRLYYLNYSEIVGRLQIDADSQRK